MINDKLKKEILDFRKKRDWEKFHKPKDLVVSIVLEAAELLENFQWKTDTEAAAMAKGKGRSSIVGRVASLQAVRELSF